MQVRFSDNHGAGLTQIMPNLIALAAMSLLYLVLGAALFKWRQN